VRQDYAPFAATPAPNTRSRRGRHPRGPRKLLKRHGLGISCPATLRDFSSFILRELFLKINDCLRRCFEKEAARRAVESSS
jgi:hypothetical protein